MHQNKAGKRHRGTGAGSGEKKRQRGADHADLGLQSQEKEFVHVQSVPPKSNSLDGSMIGLCSKILFRRTLVKGMFL